MNFKGQKEPYKDIILGDFWEYFRAHKRDEEFQEQKDERQRCKWCGSDRFERQGDVERCAQCGK